MMRLNGMQIARACMAILKKRFLQKGIELNANAHIVSNYSAEEEKVDTGEREVREVVSKNGRVSKQKFAVMQTDCKLHLEITYYKV